MTTPATSQAGTTEPATQPEIPADAIPAADSFRAVDRPDDDGSGILVEWTKPKAVPEGISYVVQVAHSEADFQAGKFKTQVVHPTPMLLGTSKPEYFGRGPGARQTYFVDVTPSKLFPPARSESLTTEKLKELYSRKELTASELARAQAALEYRQEASKQTTAPGALKAKPTPDQLATESWFSRLESYIRKRDAEKLQDKLLAIDAEPCFFRLGVRLGGRTVLVSRDGKPVIVEACRETEPVQFRQGQQPGALAGLLLHRDLVHSDRQAKAQHIHPQDRRPGGDRRSDRPGHGNGPPGDLRPRRWIGGRHAGHRLAEHPLPHRLQGGRARHAESA